MYGIPPEHYILLAEQAMAGQRFQEASAQALIACAILLGDLVEVATPPAKQIKTRISPQKDICGICGWNFDPETHDYLQDRIQDCDRLHDHHGFKPSPVAASPNGDKVCA